MDLPPTRLPEIGWFHRIVIRLRTHWVAKMLGTTLGMGGFFVVYFWLLRHPVYPVTIMPLTIVDRWIGFWPEALPLYGSLWFYVSLAPALLVDRRELVSYGVAALGLSVIGLGIFLCWPTAVPRPDVDWSEHTAFEFLKSVDAAGNACPSLHVAFAVFSALWFERLLREMGANRGVRVINWLWCAAILYSTVAIRQHVVLDVLAGALLGAVVAVMHLHWLRAASGEP